MAALDSSNPSGRLHQGIYRYGAVLLLLTATFTFVMVAPAARWALVVNVLLISGALIALVSRARVGRPITAAALGTLVVAIGCAVAAQFTGRLVSGFANLAAAGLLALIPIVIVAEVRKHLRVTAQTVTAAICVYVVFGMFFAKLAAAVADIGGSPYFAGKSGADASEYMYYSFITLATVGYGDFVPASRLGRALAVLEGLSGQLYLVTIVGLLVGLLVGHASNRQDSS